MNLYVFIPCGSIRKFKRTLMITFYGRNASARNEVLCGRLKVVRFFS
jgi:hypothetical protein